MGIIVGDKGGLLLHDEPLASILKVRLKPDRQCTKQSNNLETEGIIEATEQKC